MSRKPKKLPNTTEATIMSLLINGEKYGLELREEFQKRAGKKMPYGSLYTTLHRMEDKGFLRSRIGDSSKERGGNRRKYFELTALGSRTLNTFEQWLVELQEVNHGRLA